VSTWWTLSLLQKAEPCQPVRQRQPDRFGPARARLGLCGNPGVELRDVITDREHAQPGRI